ncbi:MAG TPA: hypothetical protein VN636_07830, partial [Acidimicrobiia bacterium]|nr:hypothetical protein [Acidimicrobiia bacterium]
MILLWCARVAWAVLPVTTGTAFADAVDGWSAAPARVAAVLLWVVWAAGLLALFVPRPWGLTLLRVVAPCAVLAALSTAFAAGGAAAGAAIATSIAAAALALSNPYATAAANAAAYGEERRIPLRIPTPLLLGPLPLAIVVCGGAISAGP